MRAFEFHKTQIIDRPQNEVFAFFVEPNNLSLITPDWLRFEIRAGGPIQMKAGARINYKIRLHGFPMKWQSEITAWEPPRRFVDEQRIGPYKYWIHEHTFESVSGGTKVADHVRYDVPGGTLINRLFVARDIEKIFSYREEKLREMLSRRRTRRTASQ